MRRIAWVFAVLSMAHVAEAQSTTSGSDYTERPRWDVNAGIGIMAVQPGDFSRGYYDDWYSTGRYSVGVGYYWTEQFKTEIEFATSGENSRYVQEFVRVPGTPIVQPVGVEQFHRVQQTSVRMVWQFFDNAWVHPYLNAGGVFNADRQHSFSPEQFYYPGDPRTTPPFRIPRVANAGTTWDYRGGVTVGGGSKFYVSTNSYINTGMQVSWAKPTTTVTFLAGFGVDF